MFDDLTWMFILFGFVFMGLFYVSLQRDKKRRK